jgi:5-methylthioadenosine/S-adenosylhomocysteine deaminase
VKLTALFNKIKYRDPTAMPAWDALRMATIEGAQAIGLGDEIGSLEVGKQGDLILVDLDALNLSPVLEGPIRNIVPNLVYAASGHEVRTVMVAGREALSRRPPAPPRIEDQADGRQQGQPHKQRQVPALGRDAH